jgi:L-threonylcarbamoyladenylate synthase
VLRGGGLVAFPTETVYGLGADVSSEAAVRRLYQAKGRPETHPCIVHLASAEWLSRYAAEVPESARVLAEAWWPGPLTLILRRDPDAVPDQVTGGTETVGLRVPAHPTARDLLAALGSALVAPSANRFGRVSPTTAEHVVAELAGDVDLVLDGGPCTVGVESTIVDCTGDEPRILRPGGITREQLTETLGRAPRVGGKTAAPGTLPSHYAPDAQVILVSSDELEDRVRDVAQQVGPDAVGVVAPSRHRRTLTDLGVDFVEAPEMLEAYAQALYGTLRRMDQAGRKVVVIELVPEEGIGVAINDRLRRAAADS